VEDPNKPKKSLDVAILNKEYRKNNSGKIIQELPSERF
jgi:hypothetical protein